MSADTLHQPKAVNWRTEDYNDHLKQVQGKLDWDTNFDNMFLKWKLVIQFLDDVEQAIVQGVIPISEEKNSEYLPDEDAMEKMRKIWYGNVWLGVIKNQEETKVLKRELFFEEPEPYIEVINDENGLHYAKPEEAGMGTRYPREVILMPRLKDLLPTFEMKPDQWGVTIRQPIPFRYAFEGVNYATVIKEGRFIHYLSDGEVQKFDQEDMKSLRLKTYTVSKAVYNAWMDILPRFFNHYYNIFQINIQKIIKFLDDVDFDEDEIEAMGEMGATQSTMIKPTMDNERGSSSYF